MGPCNLDNSGVSAPRPIILIVLVHYSSLKCRDSEVRANVYKSLLLNLLSLTSIYTFDLLLLPLVRDQQKWLHRNVGWFYQGLWLFPVIGLSFYLNVSIVPSPF